MEESPDEKLEARAERAVRRGDLLMAVDIFERLSSDHPEDERLRQRTEAVRSLLQPSELVHRRRATEPLPDQTSDLKLTDAERGEVFAAAGRYADAVRAYRLAVGAQPENELLRDRLVELFGLAPPGSRALDDGLARAPELGAAPPPSSPPPAREARSSRAARAIFRTSPGAPPVAPTPLPPRAEARPVVPAAPTGAPHDPAELLRILLARVRSAARR